MRNLSWKSGYVYCTATNRNGKPCGNTVPKGWTLCKTHRRRAERDRRAVASP